MFVPLDRLYNFVDQFVDNDVIIYQFLPHGSKKLGDLRQLEEMCNLDWHQERQAIYMIMHDQECLQFDLHQSPPPQEISALLENTRKDLFCLFKQWSMLDQVIEKFQTFNLEIFFGLSTTDKWILCHSEKNSEDLSRYQQLGAVGVYWWSHALIARDWYRFAKIDATLKPAADGQFARDFNIYCRAWTGTREYRLKFVEMLINQDLLPQCWIKVPHHDTGKHYRTHIFKNDQFKIDIDLPECSMSITDSTSSADYNSDDYVRSAIDIVLETLFDDSRLHLTEKTLRPLACGKPFVLVATAGSLAYLREYGFATFHPYIDESYDTIQDPLERLTAITKSMQRIANLPQNEKNDLYLILHQIAESNKKRFWSEQFITTILEELRENYAVAYQDCCRSRQGKKFRYLRMYLASLDPRYRKWMTEDTSMRSRQDLAQLLLSCHNNVI